MQDLAPRDTVEKILFDDVAHLVWEKQRLRRVKAATWNKATKGAVQRVLGNLPVDQWWAKQANDLWLTDPDFRNSLRMLLEKFGLDESVIAGEAMRRVAEDLEKLERSEASLDTLSKDTPRHGRIPSGLCRSGADRFKPHH
jgi:hypothetical protein